MKRSIGFISLLVLVAGLTINAKARASGEGYGGMMTLDLPFDIYAAEFTEILNQEQLAHDTSYTIADTTVADSCVAFMNKEQFLGPTGKDIYQVVLENQDEFANLMKGGSVTKYCPLYSQMDAEKKAMVWTLVLTVMAHFESSCNIKATAKGPNGTAKGYFQLHQGQEAKYDGSLETCVNNASNNAKKSSLCTLGMLEQQFKRTGGELFSSGSYWDVLRPKGRAQRADDIQRALRKSSLCQASLT